MLVKQRAAGYCVSTLVCKHGMTAEGALLAVILALTPPFVIFGLDPKIHISFQLFLDSRVEHDYDEWGGFLILFQSIWQLKTVIFALYQKQTLRVIASDQPVGVRRQGGSVAIQNLCGLLGFFGLTQSFAPRSDFERVSLSIATTPHHTTPHHTLSTTTSLAHTHTTIHQNLPNRTLRYGGLSVIKVC